MTAPHRYIKNQIVKVSRGTLNNLPLILPDGEGFLQAELRYIFARDAADCEIRILALNVEPFGYEAIIFDPKMRRSEFLKSVNQSISLAVKRRVEHRESLWSNKKPGNVPILDLDTLKSEIVKICVAPIRDGYVRNVSDWELPTIGPSDWGIETECPHPKYPDLFVAKECPGLKSGDVKTPDFDEKLKIQCESQLSQIPAFSEKIIELKDDLSTEIETFEKAERKRRRRVLGVKASRISKRFLNPKYQNPWKYMDHRKMVLCASTDRAKKIKEILKKFYLKYNSCLVSFIRFGTRTFPTGTLKMRTLFRVICKSVDEDDLFNFTF